MPETQVASGTQAADLPIDTAQQITSKNPTIRQKNPKRVAAGKTAAEKTKQAREAKKKGLAQANATFANNM